MVIQRSTLEFLIAALALGTVMAATLWLGQGAGVLVLLLWGIGLAIHLKRKSKRAASRDNGTDDT